MKHLMTLVFATAMLGASADIAETEKQANETPDAKEARIEAAKARYRAKVKEKGWDRIVYENTGGRIIKEGSGEGRVVFVNAQKRLDAARLGEFIAGLSYLYRLRMEVVDGKEITVENAAAELKATGANAAIFIVDDEKLPPSLVAYDSMWAIVNVGKLGEGPSSLMNLRIVKAVYRNFALLCGAADTPYAGSLFWPATKPEDIDLVKMPEHPVPTVVQNIEEHMTRAGMKPIVVATYIKACKEGWAPQPTNDIQKAIWEKVHSIPDKPMKIEFDPATQKGKVTN